MTLEDKIRRAEASLFEAARLDVDTTMVDLRRTGLRVRVLGFGKGRPVLVLHGVTQSAAVWTPLVSELAGYRLLAVDLPGHGLSDPTAYRRGEVRSHTVELIDDLFEALGLETAPVVAHSLGGMFALWHAAARPGPTASLVVLGDPAVAFPGVRVRMPLSPMTVPVLGSLMLRSPSPRSMYRRLLAQGLGGRGVEAVRVELLDAPRFVAQRPGNARTVAALMHAINGFRRPRPESTMSPDELGRVATPTLFVWGTDDPYLSPEGGRPSIDRMPSAGLLEVPGGHAPWLEDAAGTAKAVARHLGDTGFPPD
jgi:2-hydroxy-6-oxonona-2,4-dienedioate hydrolase